MKHPDLDLLLSKIEANKTYLSALKDILCDSETTDVDFYKIARNVLSISDYIMQIAMNNIGENLDKL